MRRGGPRARPLLATASPAEHQQKVGRRCCKPAVEAAGPSRNSRKSAFCRADRPCIRATNVCRALARPPAARLRCAEGSGTRRPPQSPGSAFVGLTNAHKRRGGRRCLPLHLIHRRRPATLPPQASSPAPALPSSCADLHTPTMSYAPSANGSVAASTAGSELDFGGETEANYTLPSLTDLVRCGVAWVKQQYAASCPNTQLPTGNLQRNAAICARDVAAERACLAHASTSFACVCFAGRAPPPRSLSCPPTAAPPPR